MYYYGYQGGYGYNSPCCGAYSYPQYGYQQSGNGYGAAIILVLFILLVIIIGAYV